MNLDDVHARLSPSRAARWGRQRVLSGFAIAAILITAAAERGLAASPGVINAIGIENEYADVIAQIGGRYVQAGAIETDPNTDPHTFEASPQVARQLAGAEIVVKNGVGYDSWADKVLAAGPKPGRKVIDVQHLLELPDSTRNPHLWYDPKTMPAVANAVAKALGTLQPAHAAYFQANAKAFVASLAPWNAAIAKFKADYPNTPIATTEPVSDYLLQAMGADIRTPFPLEAAIMNGTDPAPQDVTAENALFSGHQVKIFVYNQQVTDALTKSFLDLAKKNDIPVVGVYETMPTPGFTYQSWMVAEVDALRRAVADKTSTETLEAPKR